MRSFFWWKCECLILNHKTWRRGSENDDDWLNKIDKSLDMNFISIKSMKWKFVICTKNLLKTYNIFETKKPKPKTKNPFYFQVRQSLAPLNILTPTPGATVSKKHHKWVLGGSLTWQRRGFWRSKVRVNIALSPNNMKIIFLLSYFCIIEIFIFH